MKKEKKKLDVVFVLDKSGSMSGSEESTISSFNEYLEREKKNTFETRISTVLFSDTYSYLYQNVPVKEVKPITSKEYYVGGCTALYDALGNSISYMNQLETDKVLFIIITDGYENASKEFDKNTIKRMITKHSDWEFIYIGADIDSYATGGDIGISEENISNYKKDRVGISKLFKAVGNFEASMMDEETSYSKTHWKEELEEYLEENNH